MPGRFSAKPTHRTNMNESRTEVPPRAAAVKLTPRMRNLEGERFGKMVALYPVKNPFGRLDWICACDCGRHAKVDVGNLTSGRQVSCGCIKWKHGLGGTRIGGIWAKMLSRCLNPNAAFFSCYGGRGITVCERWNDIRAFAEDMGHAPAGWSIERVDNNAGYFPENCVWAKMKEQANNTRRNVKLTARGVTKNLAQWAEESGIPSQTIRDRMKRGWEHERAIFHLGRAISGSRKQCDRPQRTTQESQPGTSAR